MCTESLSPYTRESGSGGPTPTFTVQKIFAQRLRGVLSRINARLRDAVISRDLFLIRAQDTEALVDDPPEGIFDFPTQRRRVRGFLQWLRQQLDEYFLNVVGPDRNEFIRTAYAAGIRNVHSQLTDENVAFERPEMEDMLLRPLHRSELQTLYTRTYENLESVRDDVAQAVRDELVEGFTQAESPSAIARRLTDRVDSIGKNRSTMISRSETINAYSEGTLNRTEEINETTDADIATAHGEWDAAMDTRTCPFCRTINNVDLRPSEMRGQVVQFRGDVYRLKPPAHPNGRCNIRLQVGATIDEPLVDRLPAEVNLIT